MILPGESHWTEEPVGLSHESQEWTQLVTKIAAPALQASEEAQDTVLLKDHKPGWEEEEGDDV